METRPEGFSEYDILYVIYATHDKEREYNKVGLAFSYGSYSKIAFTEVDTINRGKEMYENKQRKKLGTTKNVGE